MDREQAIAGIRQVDERIRQAYKRREELDRQFEEIPLEEWSEALLGDGIRELTDKERELLERMELNQSRQNQVKEELYALLDEKDVLVRELCKYLQGQDEKARLRSTWEKERREMRMRIDPNDVIDISGIQIAEEADSPEQRIGKEPVCRQYSPAESEALAEFAKTGDSRSLIPLEEKERSWSGEAKEQGINPANPLGVLVLNRLTAEADAQRKGLLGRAYLNTGTLMKKSCVSKGEELFFGVAAELDWSEFSEQGREDYDNGNYERAARCLTLSVDKLLKKGEDVLDGRTAKKWLAEECRLLADIYLEGKGMAAASPERAAAYLKTAADQALDIEAAYRLGALYAEEKRIPANPGLARRYMTMAANQGHVQAGIELADAMIQQKAWAKELYSESRVLSCLNAGLKSGNGRAILYMGLLCCIQGRRDDAVTWFGKIPDWDAAKMLLGQIYFMQGDYRKAVPLLKEVCDVRGYKYSWEYVINSHVSQENRKFVRLSECMGLCYASGLGGCEKDLQKARVYLEDAAAYQGVQAQTYDNLVFIYLMDGDTSADKAEKILRYWKNGQDLGSSKAAINLGKEIYILLKNAGTDGGKKGLASWCAERLRQLAEEGNITAKYEYCAYLIHFNPYMTDGTNGRVWHYSDRNYFPGNPDYSHSVTAAVLEQFLDEAFAGGIYFAAYIKGRHYLNFDKTGKAYESFRKGADSGDLRAKNELPNFKKTLLGYSYQK